MLVTDIPLGPQQLIHRVRGSWRSPRGGPWIGQAGQGSPLPFFAQNRHHDCVPVAPIAKAFLAKDALRAEPGFLIGPLTARVELDDMKINAVEVQSFKGMSQEQARGLGAISLVPLALVAQKDAEASVAVQEVDFAQPRSAN